MEQRNEPTKEKNWHDRQDCKFCKVTHDHHKSWLYCELGIGSVERNPEICYECKRFEGR